MGNLYLEVLRKFLKTQRSTKVTQRLRKGLNTSILCLIQIFVYPLCNLLRTLWLFLQKQITYKEQHIKINASLLILNFES